MTDVITRKDLIELQIKAGFLTDESLQILFEKSAKTCRRLSGLKRRIPGGTSGIYLLDDLKNALVSDQALVEAIDI